MNFPLSNAGLTLIELIVVLAIISAVVAFSTLSLENFASERYLKTSARDLASTIKRARRLAITKRKPHRVVFSCSDGSYWIEDDENNKIDRSWQLKRGVHFSNPHLDKKGEEDGIVEFDDPEDGSLSFYPRGSAETGSIYLQEKGKGGWYTLTVAGITGYVRIYPEKH